MRVVFSDRSAFGDLPLAGRSARQRAMDLLQAYDPQPIANSEVSNQSPGFEVLWMEGWFPFLTKTALDAFMDFGRQNGSALLTLPDNKNMGLCYLNSWPGKGLPPDFKSICHQLQPKPFACKEELDPLVDATHVGRFSQMAFRKTAIAAMEHGAVLQDPNCVWIDADVVIGSGTVIAPGVTLACGSKIGSHCRIGVGACLTNVSLGSGTTILPYSVLQDSVVGASSSIGPFAHLRQGTQLGDEVKIGNFVETKKISMGHGSKASHLTYLGDAIIGIDCNIGAGTITCNYDGYNKSQTQLGDRVFVGSDSQLIAPVTMGDDSYAAAGSTITKNVPAGALAIARARQTTREGMAAKLRKKAQRRKQDSKA